MLLCDLGSQYHCIIVNMDLSISDIEIVYL